MSTVALASCPHRAVLGVMNISYATDLWPADDQPDAADTLLLLTSCVDDALLEVQAA